VASLIEKNPGISIEELHVITTGDRITDRPLQEVGGKGLFLKEIEEALLEKRAHFAVHSVKDVPADLAPGLVLAAIPEREDPRDVLVSHDGRGLRELPAGARVGTSSLRRTVLLRAVRPDLQYVPIRGNVDTRLRKAETGEVDAVVLAYAGMRRLGVATRATEVLDELLSIPAVGQGALGIECRDGDESTYEILRTTHHEETGRAVACERGVMVAVEGSCKIPVAAHARRQGERMVVDALLADAAGDNVRRLSETIAWPSTDAEARAFGVELGKRLLAT
jgi:hydroxymethylbilane synthase